MLVQAVMAEVEAESGEQVPPQTTAVVGLPCKAHQGPGAPDPARAWVGNWFSSGSGSCSGYGFSSRCRFWFVD